MKFRGVALWLLKGIAALFLFLVVAFLLFAWLRHPKFSTDNIFIRTAGPGVFKMYGIPRGRALSSQEIDDYADRLLAQMTLSEEVHQMSGDTGLLEFLADQFVTVRTVRSAHCAASLLVQQWPLGGRILPRGNTHVGNRRRCCDHQGNQSTHLGV
jgi:hypothetical protein